MQRVAVLACLFVVSSARAELPSVRFDRLTPLGGAAGSLSTLGAKGPEVADRLAARLRLNAPEMPWHSARDRMAAIGAAVAIVAGAMAKIAGDVGLLMQTDTAEAFEPSAPGKGGSSTMPHKRNPVAAASALAAATMAPNLAATIFAAQVQDHERSAGPWHAEWPTLPTLLLVTSGGIAAIVDIAEGLEVDAARMRANLDATDGLIMAEAVAMRLAERIGKSDAHHLVEAAGPDVGADPLDAADGGVRDGERQGGAAVEQGHLVEREAREVVEVGEHDPEPDEVEGGDQPVAHRGAWNVVQLALAKIFGAAVEHRVARFGLAQHGEMLFVQAEARHRRGGVRPLQQETLRRLAEGYETVGQLDAHRVARARNSSMKPTSVATSRSVTALYSDTRRPPSERWPSSP